MSVPTPVDRETLLNWLKAHLAAISGGRSEDVDDDHPLSRYDLDSVDAVQTALDVETAFGFPLHPDTFLHDDATVGALADALFSAAATATG